MDDSQSIQDQAHKLRVTNHDDDAALGAAAVGERGRGIDALL